MVQQKVQTETQMKRIARDRNEQITQKKRDGRKLMKRNKNEVSDLMEKQNYEIKTIVSFMKFSLGKRAPKEEEKEAYVPDRIPTILELARPQFMGLRDQRPVEMLKNELQKDVVLRKNFNKKVFNLPKLKDLNSNL